MQVEGSCNALWPQGQGGDSTIYSFDSNHHCVGCSSPSLDIQHKSTSKSEMQLQGKSSNEEIRKPSRISGESAVGPCGQIWEEETLPTTVNLTFSSRKGNVKNYFFGYQFVEGQEERTKREHRHTKRTN